MRKFGDLVVVLKDNQVREITYVYQNGNYAVSDEFDYTVVTETDIKTFNESPVVIKTRYVNNSLVELCEYPISSKVKGKEIYTVIINGIVIADTLSAIEAFTEFLEAI